MGSQLCGRWPMIADFRWNIANPVGFDPENHICLRESPCVWIVKEPARDDRRLWRYHHACSATEREKDIESP